MSDAQRAVDLREQAELDQALQISLAHHKALVASSSPPWEAHEAQGGFSEEEDLKKALALSLDAHRDRAVGKSQKQEAPPRNERHDVVVLGSSDSEGGDDYDVLDLDSKNKSTPLHHVVSPLARVDSTAYQHAGSSSKSVKVRAVSAPKVKGGDAPAGVKGKIIAKKMQTNASGAPQRASGAKGGSGGGKDLEAPKHPSGAQGGSGGGKDLEAPKHRSGAQGGSGGGKDSGKSVYVLYGGGQSDAEKSIAIRRADNRLKGRMPDPKSSLNIKILGDNLFSTSTTAAGALWVETGDVNGHTVPANSRGVTPTDILKHRTMYEIPGVGNSVAANQFFMELCLKKGKKDVCKLTLTAGCDGHIMLIVEKGSVWVNGYQKPDGRLIEKQSSSPVTRIVMTQRIFIGKEYEAEAFVYVRSAY